MTRQSRSKNRSKNSHNSGKTQHCAPSLKSVQALIKNGNEKSIMPIHLSSEDDLYHQENDNQCQGLLLCLCVVWRPLLELDSRIDGCCCFITVCKAAAARCQDKLILFLLILAWKNHQVKTLQKPFILMENEIFCLCSKAQLGNFLHF